MEAARQNRLSPDEARMKQRKRDREIDDEIAEHLAREIELRIERGVPREQAEAEARKIFGNATRVKETTRGIWAAKLIEQFSFDSRYALRSLAKSPAFTLAALATLALGIGLNTAIFSTVNSVLLRPLPYRDPQRLMQLWETHPVIHSAQVAYPDFIDWRSQTKTFEQIAAYTFQGLQQFNLVVNGEPEQVDASLVSGNLLPALGLQPAPSSYAPRPRRSHWQAPPAVSSRQSIRSSPSPPSRAWTIWSPLPSRAAVFRRSC